MLAEVEDLRDVDVLDAGGDVRLVEEHLLEARIGRVLGADHLHRDGLLEAVFAAQTGRPHRGHSSLREWAEELVAIESRAGCGDQWGLRRCGAHGEIMPRSLDACERWSSEL